MCIKEKIETYCISNADDFKCKIFERCKGTSDEGEIMQNLLAKKQCVKDFCEEPDHEDEFECLALACRQNYDLPPQKLMCIKEACASNGDKKICQKINACQAQNRGELLGVLKVFKCLKSTVFDGVDF